MSAFTEQALLKKLFELNSSQQSIQTLSLWLIHHRKHHVGIVKTWFKELQKVPEQKKLTYMYLANDVIQNSKKKGPEYGKEFELILNKVFCHICDTCEEEKLYMNLYRILQIWEDRGVYDKKTINEFRNSLTKGSGKDENDKKVEVKAPEKRKIETTKTDPIVEKKHRSSKSTNEDKTKTVDLQNNIEAVSPQTPIGEPPEPEELVKALTDLENSASSDAAVRERIANLPAEISELHTISKLEDKEAAAKLSKEINEAVQLLNEYNARLAMEMEDRKKLAVMLRNFQAEQKELLEQAEQRLEEYTKKLAKYKDIQKEIKDHLSNLPDLRQLPDVSGGFLAPLPSAGDLFNIH
ncbi:regulation of nuclear pre-mRNA domain-containing protein 1B [Condylostylus longicornis]|uniref:regulation of nuclear pre-mRNA domain-containing protein 1B n=1 Tax=Condylostylus longicornis TaxID=2530218 RepID=UPI00244DEB1F|nr:regulation of nuclear pre-mRNA domain-containing protein 1B [Condylostylus longicornis]